MQFPSEYPHKPPKVTFLTPMFHPNIFKTGEVCIDILRSKWVPVYTVETILISVQVVYIGNSLYLMIPILNHNLSMQPMQRQPKC